MLHLPQNLRLIRLLSDQTQTEFGKKFGATKAMIISYEKGKASPDELFLSRVSKYAGVSENDLMTKRLTEPQIQVKRVDKVEMVPSEQAANDPEAEYLASRRSLEKTLENMSEDKIRSTAIIERLVALLERQHTPIDEPGPHHLDPNAKMEDLTKKKTSRKAG